MALQSALHLVCFYSADIVWLPGQVLDLYLEAMNAKAAKPNSCATSSTTPGRPSNLPSMVPHLTLITQPDSHHPKGPASGADGGTEGHADLQPSSPKRKLDFSTAGLRPLASPEGEGEGVQSVSGAPALCKPRPGEPTNKAQLPVLPEEVASVEKEAIALESNPGPQVIAAVGVPGKQQGTGRCGTTVITPAKRNEVGQKPSANATEPKMGTCDGGVIQSGKESCGTMKRKRGRPRKTGTTGSASGPSPPPDQTGGGQQDVPSGRPPRQLQPDADDTQDQLTHDLPKQIAHASSPVDEIVPKLNAGKAAGITNTLAPNNVIETALALEGTATGSACRLGSSNGRGRKRAKLRQEDIVCSELEQKQSSNGASGDPDPTGMLGVKEGSQVPKDLPSATAQASCALHTPVQLHTPVPKVTAVSHQSEVRTPLPSLMYARPFHPFHP
jgi:hypothetical protein